MAKSKETFDLIAETESANFKVTLLEKHLMENREAYNELKTQELALREQQAVLLSDMQKTLELTKKVDQVLSESINDKIESIKTEMFGEWQDSIKLSIVSQSALLTEQKLTEYDEIYKKQNAVIEKQSKLINTMLTNTKIMRILSYAVVVVAMVMFALIPALQYVTKETINVLEEFSVWGLIVMIFEFLMIILMIALAILLRNKKPKREK